MYLKNNTLYSLIINSTFDEDKYIDLMSSNADTIEEAEDEVDEKILCQPDMFTDNTFSNI